MFKLQKGYDEYVTKTFRLPREFVEELEKIAFENNLSLNQLVIQCLKYSIDNLDTSEK
jgi:predicted HicB family RNase H-like nuclease